MKQIRVVVAEVPHILRAIIEDAVGLQPDMELIAGCGRELPVLAGRGSADVVIVAEDQPGDARAHRQVLVDNPDVKMLVVTAGGHAAHLQELRRVPVDDVSAPGLVEAIRAAVRATEGGPRH